MEKTTPYIDIHTHNPGGTGIAVRSRRLGIGEAVPQAPFSEGIHPWDVTKVHNPDAIFDEMLRDDMVAVGETGLDKLHPAFELQEEFFRAQLSIARQRSLPVIIHCVKAFEETMKILGEYPLPAVIFHSYTGSREQIMRVSESGYYISLGEVSLHSSRTVEGLAGFPPERIFLETDDRPVAIESIYDEAAGLLGIGLENLKEQVYINYQKLFCL